VFFRVWLTLDLDKKLQNLPQDRTLFGPMTLKKFVRASGVTMTNAELQTKMMCTHFAR